MLWYHAIRFKLQTLNVETFYCYRKVKSKMPLPNLRSEYPHLAGLIREFRRTTGNKSDLVRERSRERAEQSRGGSPRGRAAPRLDARDGTSTRWSGSGIRRAKWEERITSPVRRQGVWGGSNIAQFQFQFQGLGSARPRPG